MSIIWADDAWNDYLFWQEKDKRKLKKINDLIKDINRNGELDGIGKPEKLKYCSGYSRRIDETNRLVYEIDENGQISIVSCRGHYEE